MSSPSQLVENIAVAASWHHLEELLGGIHRINSNKLNRELNVPFDRRSVQAKETLAILPGSQII